MKSVVRVVLPAFNEAASLRTLLPELVEALAGENFKYRIYVVDDGSRDKTRDVVLEAAKKNARIRLICHRNNRGLAEAVNTGFRAAVKESAKQDVVVTMDADNTHLPGLIIRMVRLVREGHDVVISSRFTPGSLVRGVSWLRQGLSLGASWLFRLLFPIRKVRDYTSGYRAYNVELLARAFGKFGRGFINQKGFSCMVEILLKLRKLDPVVAEVPMVLRYDLKEGKSKMKVVKTLLETLGLVGKYLPDRLGEIMQSRKIYLWLGLVFGVTRVYGLTKLPLFSDEAYAMVRAREIWLTGDWWGMLKFTTGPIFIWLVAIMQKLPVSVVAASRLAAGASGLVTAFLLAAAARRLVHPRTGVVAFILVMLMPFALFYDRTVLFESMTLMFITAAMLAPAVAVPLAILTKQIGWLALPLAVGLNIGNKRRAVTIILLGVLVPFLVWMLAFNGWGQLTAVMFEKAGAPLTGAVDFRSNLLRSKLWMLAYVTRPILLLFGVGLTAVMFEAMRARRWFTPLVVIGGWTVAVFLFENKVAGIFYPRYLFPVVLGVVLLATKGWWVIWQWICRLRGATGRLVLAFGLWFLILFPAVRFLQAVLLGSERSLLPAETRFQFYEDWTSGVGSQELVEAVRSEAAGVAEARVYVEEENSYYVILGADTEIEVRVADWLRDPLDRIPERVISEPGVTMLVRNRHPDIPDDWPVELIQEVAKTESRSVYLYRVKR